MSSTYHHRTAFTGNGYNDGKADAAAPPHSMAATTLAAGAAPVIATRQTRNEMNIFPIFYDTFNVSVNYDNNERQSNA